MRKWGLLLFLLFVAGLGAIVGCVTRSPHSPMRPMQIGEALTGLKSKDTYVRGTAIWSLGKRGEKEFTKDIAEFLKDEEMFVRGYAVWALGELGTKEYAK